MQFISYLIAAANVVSKGNFAFWHVIGKLYITGGQVNGKKITNNAEVFDVPSKTGEVKALPPMVEPRRWHTSAAAGPFIFAFGGVNEQNKEISSYEFYDSRTST